MRLLFNGLLLGSEAGFYSGAYACEHVFGRLRELALRMKLEIFLEGFGSTFGRNHFVALEGGFTDQIDALPIVSLGFGGIGGNDLIEGDDASSTLPALVRTAPTLNRYPAACVGSSWAAWL